MLPSIAEAYWQSRAQVAISAGGGASTTWNPADKNAAFDLTNGNLTATVNVDTTYVSVRAIASNSSGKHYYELTLTGVVNAANMITGIANSTESLTGFCGQSTNSIGYQASGGVVYINGSPTTGSPIQTSVESDVLCVAVDLGNSKIWYRTNGGNWNNDVIGNQNPATNTGGISISGLAAGPYFPCASGHSHFDAWTANFGGSAYAQTPPSGFGNW